MLQPTALTVRRADTTEVIGTALVAKAGGIGHRTIATRLDRPVSTARRWLRRVPPAHADWLHQRGVQRAAEIDRELLAPQWQLPQRQTALGHALDVLARAALRYRERLALDVPVWALIGFFACGRLLPRP